jgi:hypothetical protein
MQNTEILQFVQDGGWVNLGGEDGLGLGGPRPRVRTRGTRNLGL